MVVPTIRMVVDSSSSGLSPVIRQNGHEVSPVVVGQHGSHLGGHLELQFSSDRRHVTLEGGLTPLA
jgi:hypothetical protein